MPLTRITSKRRLVQGLLIAAALLLPFVTISGNPFLRMDIANMTLVLQLWNGDRPVVSVAVSP